jgi:excisionase family DNA binding protein
MHPLSQQGSLQEPTKPAPSSTRLGHTQLEQVSPNRRVCVGMSESWLSADDIAAHLGVTKDTVYSWIADKAMPAHKVGRLWKFQASEVDEWVRSGGAAASEEVGPPD